MIELKPTSWKIMLEVLYKGKPTVVREVPIDFQERKAGKSHFSFKQMMLYLWHLVVLWRYRHKGTIKRMSSFGLIGLVGMVINFTLLYVLTDLAGLWYIFSAILAIIVASTNNYFLNHIITFRGWNVGSHFKGWLKYQVVSATTDLIYVGLLALFVEVAGLWYMVGAIISVLIVFPIKYSIASKFIWSRSKRDPDAPEYEWITFYKGNKLQRWWKGAIAKTIWDWIPSSDSLLNIGCGSSPIASKYPKSFCIDANKDKLIYLKGKLPELVTVHTQAEELPFLSSAFDHVLCIEMIEHSYHADKVVKEIERMLKPGGRAIISTPDYNKAFWKIAKVFVGREDDHVTHLSKEELERLCKNHGLMPARHRYVATCDLVEEFIKPNGTG